ncbi:probable tRNA (uracil-O(2)-)-methyltransferase [Orycteropus afer afer]|uniref:tRNA (uracil-O(2)-)-methyltransferase n=1 Tax=Orycteropus afer afer TaxID=1230840 RepID=A0A8B7B883_ORYAF|nr:probable tRNA (uracil-O(2)-)-methyltransferase [Orycteropus afer afer]
MAEVGRVAVGDPCALLPGGFWAAMAVWLERPQVANKRLCGARLDARRSAALPRARQNAGSEPEEREPGPDPRAPEGSPSPRPRARAEEGTAGRVPGDPGRPSRAGGGGHGFPAADLDSLWGDFSRSLASDSGEMLAFLAGSEAGSQEDAPRELDVLLRTIIPKTKPRCPLTAPRTEMVVQDPIRGAVTFFPLEEDADGNLRIQMSNVYQIRLCHGPQEWFLSVLIFCPERWHCDGVVYPRSSWLGQELLARLARWSVENRKTDFKSTLSLVSVEKYGRLYQELKARYKELVKVWPEVTDPEKFVYEDVAIATYLLVLWEEERAARGQSQRQSFVDLGCGNGLLTHILSSAGVCLVGMSRTYPPAREASVDEHRTQYIHSQRSPGGRPPRAQDQAGPQDAGAAAEPVPTEVPAEGLWLPGFQPRAKVERVRNATSLPRDVTDQAVLQVARLLLGGKQLRSGGSTQDAAGKAWDRGGSLSLSEVASKLDPETLQRLKQESGGLQTLLRNHHQVFAVQNGRIRFRDWREEQPQRATRPGRRRGRGVETFKTRPCWFFTYHPDGCALPAASCLFAHGPEELRAAPRARRPAPPPEA